MCDISTKVMLRELEKADKKLAMQETHDMMNDLGFYSGAILCAVLFYAIFDIGSVLYFFFDLGAKIFLH